MESQNVHYKMANAAKWSLGAELFAKLITPFTSMVLARVLLPEDFGIVTTMTMVISFGDLISDAGFSKFLVQHKFSDDCELMKSANTAFWTNLVFSSILFGFICAFSKYITKLVGATGYDVALIVGASKLLITSFSAIQRAIYQRSLDYRTLFYVRMIVSLIPVAITIPLALKGYSYWSLIIGTLINELVYAVALTIRSEWRPRIYFRISKLKEMLSYSVWSLLEQVTIWVTTYVDSFIIGKYLSQYYLGVYKQPYQLLNNIFSVLTASIFTILFSALSRFNDIDDKKGYNDTIINTQRFLSLVLIPAGVGMFVFRSFVRTILLGNQWKDSDIVIGAFALERVFQLIVNNTASEIYRSKGKPYLSAAAQMIFACALSICCFVSLEYGFNSFVAVRALSCVLFSLIHWVIIMSCFSINIYMTIPLLKNVLLSSVFMGAIGIILRIVSRESIVFSIFSIIVCAAVYLFFICMFSDTRDMLISCLRKINICKKTTNKLIIRLDSLSKKK